MTCNRVSVIFILPLPVAVEPDIAATIHIG